LWNFIALEIYATFKPHRQKVAMRFKFEKKEWRKLGQILKFNPRLARISLI